MRYLAGFVILFMCACSHNEPAMPDRSQTFDRNRPDTIKTEQKDSVFNQPEDTISDLPPILPDIRPAGSITPIVGGFDCTPYGRDEYKIEYTIINANECGMITATILYGTDPDNLKPARTEFYAGNGHIVANVGDMQVNTQYYMRCRITMAEWYYDTELRSYLTR